MDTLHSPRDLWNFEYKSVQSPSLSEETTPVFPYGC